MKGAFIFCTNRNNRKAKLNLMQQRIAYIKNYEIMKYEIYFSPFF